MARVRQVLQDEDFKRAAPSERMDLTAQLDELSDIRNQGGKGALIDLEEGDNVRSIKRRYSLAAKSLGLNLRWRTAPEGSLKFSLWMEGEPAPGGRARSGGSQRKARAEA